MASLTYQSDYLGLVESGKSLKFDPDGYVDITVGALNAFNSAGAYYVYDQAKAVFDISEHFMRRVKEGALYGEYGHPKPLPGMSKKDFLIRILTIDEKFQSHHFKDITLIENGAKNRDGSPVVLIQARLKPRGPYGQYVGESLENAPENTAFSIRSITDDYFCPQRRCVIKIIRQCVTFDYVIEPGIFNANKYRTMINQPQASTEGLSLQFDQKTVRGAMAFAKEHALGLENASLDVHLNRLLKDTQMERRESGLILPKSQLPQSARW